MSVEINLPASQGSTESLFSMSLVAPGMYTSEEEQVQTLLQVMDLNVICIVRYCNQIIVFNWKMLHPTRLLRSLFVL